MNGQVNSRVTMVRYQDTEKGRLVPYIHNIFESTDRSSGDSGPEQCNIFEDTLQTEIHQGS